MIVPAKMPIVKKERSSWYGIQCVEMFGKVKYVKNMKGCRFLIFLQKRKSHKFDLQ